jgi:hypothetical protein
MSQCDLRQQEAQKLTHHLEREGIAQLQQMLHFLPPLLTLPPAWPTRLLKLPEPLTTDSAETATSADDAAAVADAAACAA